MTDLTFSLIAVIAFAIVFFALWAEYRMSGCSMGGAYTGKDNWLLRTIRRAKSKKNAHSTIRVRDICDI
ncbi:MAG: hypothetical protein HON65_02525 [Rhodospirillales bacterium]|jgi:hypothetical protein|nr:hypothetical protein [Rhodospirillales bacterium]